MTPSSASRNLRTTFVAVMLAGTAHAQFTEVPTTAEVGAWLIEADVVGGSWDARTVARDGITQRTWWGASTFVSTGVARNVDVQIGFEPYVRYTYDGPDGRTTSQGRGGLYLRGKWNFHGDESTGPAWAVLPYVIVPTHHDEIGTETVQGGIILPYGRPLGESVFLNAMLSLDWVDHGARGRDALLGASVVVTRQLSDRWALYGETGCNVNPRRSGEWGGLAGVGLTWSTTQTLSWDLAVYCALTRSAPDVTGVLRLVWTL